jgi:UDP-N-acetylglucosamine acyltransferase
MSVIHPTALVDRHVELGEDVRIGAYAVLEGRISLGSGTIVGTHSVIHGNTVIGARCQIGPAAYVGTDPQHLHFDRGSETWAIIGDDTLIREGASVHRATKPGKENATRVGKNCFLMGASHVAHDCRVGDHVVMANGALLGGHCHVGERAFLGGASVIHQFCRVGRLAVISGNEAVSHDIPPFAAARYGGIKGYNAVGCKRAGMSTEAIHAIRAAFQCLHSHRTTPAAVAAIRKLESSAAAEVQEILDFIASARRGLPPSVRFIARGGQTVEDD